MNAPDDKVKWRVMVWLPMPALDKAVDDKDDDVGDDHESSLRVKKFELKRKDFYLRLSHFIRLSLIRKLLVFITQYRS